MRFQHGFQWTATAPSFKNRPDLFSRLWLLLAAAALLALTGCATTRPAASSFVRQQSQALSPDTPTPLAASFSAARAAHPGESGFHLLIQGKEALAARIALARSATRTLDIQYYIANEDNTGKLLLEAAVRAAERGVRVRMLIDDMNFKDIDSIMAVLNSTKNIEIRVFNPFATRDEGVFRRAGNVVTHLDTLTRRMHNKAMIADNQAAITGGRNVGDEYFDASPSITFRDIDILSVGPIVPDISHSFDVFWNSEESYPLKALNNQRFKAAKIAKVRAQLRQHWDEMSAMTSNADLDEPPLARQIRTGQTPLIWAKATFLADTPRKIITPTDNYVSPPTQRIWQLADQSKQSFILISPYFVPHNDSIDHLGAMVAKGVNVSVLTNSLAATDAPAVQAGYAPARVPLLQKGVSLYEFKPINGERRPGLIGAHSRASLHAKAYVFDNKILLIGSPNLDPRSAGLNTEIAIEVDSPELAAQVTNLFDKAASLDESYHVTLADRDALSQTGSSGAPPSPLIWTTRDHGQLQTYNFDPDAGLWRNVLTGIFFILPLKNQL